MKGLSEKFRKSGLLVIGVSDEDPKLIEKYVAEHEIKFPIARLDEKSTFESAINTKAFPHSAVIGPDGKLLWEGRPSECDAIVDKAAKMSKATPLLPAACKNAEKLAQDGKLGPAWVELKKVVEAGTLQGDDLEAVEGLITYIDKSANTLWDQAEEAVKATQWLDAAEACDKLATAYAGTEPGTKGTAKLAELRADPLLVKEIDAGKELRKGADLEKAIEWKDAQKVYKAVVAKYVGTEAAKTAQGKLDMIKKDGLLNMDKNCSLCVEGNRPCSKHQK